MLKSCGRSLLAPALLLLVTGSSLSHEAYGQMRGGQRGGQQQTATAMHDLAYAQENVERLKERGERALSHDKNWAAAKTAVTQAQKNLGAVREQVKQQTMAKPEYQTLAAQMEQGSSETQAADARMKTANMVWDDQQKSSDYAEAKAHLAAAQADLDARWTEYEQKVLANDPGWRSAIAARDAARQQLSSAMAPQRSGGVRSASSGGSGRSSGGYGRSGGSGRSSRY